MNTPACTPNSDEWERLLSAVVDGNPAAEDVLRIEALLAQDEAFRAAYLERLELHAMLAWQLHWKNQGNALATPVAPVRAWPIRKWAARLAVAACLLMGVFAAFYWAGENSPAAACARLIDVYEKSGDRVYKISAQYDEHDREPDPPVFDPRRAPLPTMDGATLYVGRGDTFVLSRVYANGELLINGGNGHESWSIRGDGDVRLSKNPARFRGDIPGEKNSVAFIDMRSNLDRLKSDYTLANLDSQKLNAQSAAASLRLRGTKKSPDYAGPQSVEIWYDPASGLIQRMIFDGMTRGNWAPSRATLDLINQNEQPANWYEHDGHHEPGRHAAYVDQ